MRAPSARRYLLNIAGRALSARWYCPARGCGRGNGESVKLAARWALESRPPIERVVVDRRRAL
jgi:hypothetical protein